MSQYLKGNWVVIGSCSVDSGTLMIIDPCYIDGGFDYDAWAPYDPTANDCLRRDQTALGVIPCPTDSYGLDSDLGVAFSTAYGDGSYTVWGRLNSAGRVVAIMVDTEDDGDEEEYWDRVDAEEY
jgi:hypothetical protein